jgi:predicted nicotinamide N-methyase
MNRRATPADRRAFVVDQTKLAHSALVPGIKLYLASEITPLWRASEEFLEIHNVAPPFWAFAWPGSEALARHVAENPSLVAGKRVLDFAAGCGLAGIACAQAGAAYVDAAEIDPVACAAIVLNAGANEVKVTAIEGDIVGQPCRWDVILCGDVCYEVPMTRHILPWLRECAATATVIIADPGRAYVPREGTSAIARFEVPTSLDLEDSTSRLVTLSRLMPTAVA